MINAICFVKQLNQLTYHNIIKNKIQIKKKNDINN